MLAVEKVNSGRKKKRKIVYSTIPSSSVTKYLPKKLYLIWLEIRHKMKAIIIMSPFKQKKKTMPQTTIKHFNVNISYLLFLPIIFYVYIF